MDEILYRKSAPSSESEPVPLWNGAQVDAEFPRRAMVEGDSSGLTAASTGLSADSGVRRGAQVDISARSEFPASRLDFPAQSAPGSETSREAAEGVDVNRECLKCLQWFATQSLPRTRHELAAAVYPQDGGLGSATGRANDLLTLKLIAEVGKQGKRATLSITEKGKNWLAGRVRAAA